MDFALCTRNFAFQSRLFVIILQVLFNYLIRDHDAKVFNPPSSVKPNAADQVVDFALGGFRRWDAVYFLHIAEHGYTYENTLAFFPLFPLIIRGVANSSLCLLQYCMSYASVLLLSAALVNIVFFVLSAMTLYELGRIILGSDALAYRAAQFYCINPASIFFSAAYSESCYVLLTFRGMLLLERGHWISSAIFFALSGAARSNGLVNIGFLLHRAIYDVVALLHVRAKNGISLSEFGLNICRISALLVLCVVPFAAFQYRAYTVYCNRFASYQDLPEHIRQYGIEMGYRMPYMGPSVWCSSSFPLSYSYIQSSHWNVGFLNYYEWKQIPNFLLATPMATLCVVMIVSYLWKHGSYCIYAGFIPRGDAEHVTEDEWDDGLPRTCFVYVVHTAFLLVFGILCMHVQVITRFIASSCPVIYWFVAMVTLPRQPQTSTTHPGSVNMEKKVSGDETEPVCRHHHHHNVVVYWDFLSCHSSWPTQAVFIYFVLYVFIGVAAFVNFLPWT